MSQQATALDTPNANEDEYRMGASLTLLARFVRPYGELVAATLLALVLDLGGMLFVPTELASMINTALNQGGLDELMRHGATMLAAALVGSGGAVTTSLLAARLSAKVGRDIRVAIYEASLVFSGSDFERFGTGSMITRTLSDATVIQQTLLMAILMIMPVPIMTVISVVLAFRIDVVMGWILLAITGAVLVITIIAVRISAPIFTRLQGFIDRMNARLREAITGVRVIRAFGKEASSRERLDGTFTEYAENAIKANLLFSTADSMTFFLMNSAEVLIIWLGADRVGAQAMQIGSITALIEYALLIMFFMMMAQFALLSVPRALACLERARQVLEVTPEIADPATAPGAARAGAPAHGLADTSQSGAPVAAFDHVSFRFHDASEDTLHDLSFELRRGEVTAIIGNTGSGKSTIARMLLRFHDVTEGRLLFGGVDVRDLTQDELRSRISYVPQKAWLFSGTIAENLRHGAADATDERLWHALEAAQAGFVRTLPDGLESRVAQGGTNFSGGQRQRLAIARALVRDADLYVFDDSFSALDFKTDAALRHALKPELGRAAMLIIAQRVGTIRDADQIVVFKDGRLVGFGRHDDLMDSCPTYREIAESQERKEENHG